MEGENKGIALVCSAVGVLLRLTFKPPKTIAQFVVYAVCGTTIGMVSTPYINATFFASSAQTLYITHIVMGLCGLSIASGIFVVVEKQKEDIANKLMKTPSKEKEVDEDNTESPEIAAKEEVTSE